MRVEAFNDFWLDCYTTMLYSVLLSANIVDKAYIYNNEYKYQLIDEKVPETNEKFISVTTNMNTNTLQEKMFKNEQRLDLYNQENPIEIIKNKLDDQCVILLRVDLFYWLDENYHYEKNHVFHLSLVRDYDDSKKELIVLETGNDGYKEYSIPYERAISAITSAKAVSLVYNVNYESTDLMYTKQDVVLWAKEIIDSIDQVYNKQNAILSIDNMSNDGVRYVSDILQTHLFSIQNREKVNRHLFMILFENSSIEECDFCEEFERLENAFETLKNVCVKNRIKNNVREVLNRLKGQICSLLIEEKNIWQLFLERQEELNFRF